MAFSVSSGPDTVAPTVAITNPTSGSSFATTVGTLAMAGTSADNVGVTQVSWSNDRGGSGTATGATSWSTSVALQSGVNVVSVDGARRGGQFRHGSAHGYLYANSGHDTPDSHGLHSGGRRHGRDGQRRADGDFQRGAGCRNGVVQYVRTAQRVEPAGDGFGYLPGREQSSHVVTPSAALASGVAYTLTARGGAADPRVKDVAGNALAANYVVGFTTASNGCPCSIWPASAVPAVLADSDTSAVELGVKFRADASGVINGVRFYKSSTNTGTHVGHLWTVAGQLLASVTFTGETASGWQQATFATPVAITANTIYVVSYSAPNGQVFRQFELLRDPPARTTVRCTPCRMESAAATASTPTVRPLRSRATVSRARTTGSTCCIRRTPSARTPLRRPCTGRSLKPEPLRADGHARDSVTFSGRR